MMGLLGTGQSAWFLPQREGIEAVFKLDEGGSIVSRKGDRVISPESCCRLWLDLDLRFVLEHMPPVKIK